MRIFCSSIIFGAFCFLGSFGFAADVVVKPAQVYQLTLKNGPQGRQTSETVRVRFKRTVTVDRCNQVSLEAEFHPAGQRSIVAELDTFQTEVPCPMDFTITKDIYSKDLGVYLEAYQLPMKIYVPADAELEVR